MKGLVWCVGSLSVTFRLAKMSMSADKRNYISSTMATFPSHLSYLLRFSSAGGAAGQQDYDTRAPSKLAGSPRQQAGKSYLGFSNHTCLSSPKQLCDPAAILDLRSNTWLACQPPSPPSDHPGPHHPLFCHNLLSECSCRWHPSFFSLSHASTTSSCCCA